MNLSDPHELATLLEGILLAAGKPLSLERLAELFDEAERPEPGSSATPWRSWRCPARGVPSS